MKKTVLALCLSLLPLSLSAEGRSLKDWLKDLDSRLRRTEERHKGRLTAAASVRGAKQEDSSKLYWKGRKGNQAVTSEEIEAFKAAVGLAGEGKTSEARKGLEEFMAKFPGSPLGPDAQSTLALLPVEPVPAAAPESAPVKN